MSRERRVVFFGLDCASPELVFGRWRAELPVLSGLLDGASYGPLHAVHPPITIPAWASMLTGRDPGELGIYGFHQRLDRGGGRARLVDARSLRTPTVWDLAGRAGLDSIVVGFPPSYPVTPLRGCMVSGPLTPPDSGSTTFPEGLAAEISGWVGDYRFDIEAHRSGDLERVRAEVFEMTRKRFGVLRELLRRRPWRFCFVHEIGLDRLQHACWPDDAGWDDPLDPGARSLLEYYRLLDAEIGATLELVPEDAVVLVASDHGARRLEGSFCINEWLRAEGHLVLRQQPTEPAPLDPAQVDWVRTEAWAEGGYCGRVYLPRAPRDAGGTLASAAGRALRERIREKLEALRGPDGAPLGNAVCTPQEVYAGVRGIAPDLMVYPADLALRCAGSVGHGRLFLDGNDAGPDRANHTWEGLFLLRDPERPGPGRIEGCHQLDVAPTLLDRLGLAVPSWMRGGTLA
jgi:predicted AlkP superfamily phosphohydrolase/phosphomutase